MNEKTKKEIDELRAAWMTRASEIQTIEELAVFLTELTEVDHDYSSIAEAFVAGMYGTLKALDRSKAGGITGFQASAVAFKLLSRINGWNGPLRLFNYEDMLYPQYVDRFAQEISADTWSWLRAQATKKLGENGKKPHDERAHPSVEAHWRSIMSFIVPFGFTLAKKET